MKRNNNKKVTVNTQIYYTLYSIQSVAMTCMMKINHTLGWIFPEQEKTCLRIPYHASIARQTHNYSLTSTQLYLSLPLSLDEGTDLHTIDLLYTHEAKKTWQTEKGIINNNNDDNNNNNDNNNNYNNNDNNSNNLWFA